MSGIDHLLQRLRKQREEGRRRDGEQQLARFLATKLSWRGSYRRLLCITPTHVLTLYPDTLAVTNSWAYTGDHDLAGIEVGREHAEGGLVTFHFRRDKKGLGKDAKFACRERAGLLAALYRGVELAVARGSSGLGPTLLGPAEQFNFYKLRRGRWQPAVLRVTAHAVERLDPGTGLVKWRLEYRHMASPAARLLAPGAGQPAGQGAFALFGKTGRSPRVYCCSGREAVLKAIQTAALRKQGLTLAVDSNAALDGAQLLAAVAAAERERAATAADAPLGEWEVLKVRDLDAGDLAASRAAADVGGWSGVAQRRLVLTHKGLLERRPGDYEVAEWRQLAAVAALVRFAEDPQWLAVEWADGTPAATYVTPARDALLAALLDAAQTAAGRPIPVLCQPTAAGEPIVTQRGQALAAPAIVDDPELDKLCLHQLNAAAKDFMSSGGGAASLAALALAGLSAASAVAAAAGVGGGEAAPLLAGGSEGAGSESGSDTAGSSKAPPHAADSSSSGGSSAGLFAAGRSGFMQRAFARQPAAPHAGGGSSGSDGGGPGSEQAWALFQQRVREFNACVAYAGLSAGSKVDDLVIMALLAHLPRQQAAAGQHGLGMDEARLTVAALQCLQRLSGATVLASGRSGSAAMGMSQIIGAAGGAGRIFAALLSGHDHVAAEAARLLLRFFAPSAARAGVGPWAGEAGAGSAAAAPQSETNEEEAAAAHSAKSVCFISQTRCAALVRVLHQSRGAPLLSMAVAEAMAAVVCEPGSRTTDQATLDALLQETAALGRPLFTLFSHPAPRVAHAAALLMRAVAEGGAEAAQPMREAALTEGAILQHLLSALSGRPGGHSALSRDLVALWADEYAAALALLKRIFPPGLIRYLNQRRQQPAAATGAPPAAAAAAAAPAVAAQPPAADGAAGRALPAVQQQQQPAEGQQGAASALAATQQLVAAASAAPGPSADPLQQNAANGTQQQQQQQQQQQADASPLEQRYMSPPPHRPGTLKGNWEAFWAAVGRDHAHAALIWNEGTRAELREALQAEEGALRLARLRAAGAEAGGATLAWNHAEFRVAYPSLSKHLCIGGIFIRLLLEAPQPKAGAATAGAGQKSVVERLPAPKEFFSAAHHRLLCLGDASLAGAAGGLLGSTAGSLGGAAPAGGASYGKLALGSASGAMGGVRADAEGDRELCVRAMAAAYHVHAGVIGPVEGIAHLVALLDATPSRPLRQHLLLLLEALVAPSCLAPSGGTAAGTASSAEAPGAGLPLPPPAGQEASARAAHANGVALVEAGGVQLMVDLVAAAHEASDRPVVALQTNLIAASSHAEEAREWFYWKPQAAGGTTAGTAGGTAGAIAGTAGQPQAGTEEGRVGPVSKVEVRQLYSSGAVTGATFFWAAGMPEPLPLAAVRELRWWVAHRHGPLTAFEVAAAALRVLQALADQQPAVDAQGEVLFPLPLAHRLMASPACLPHLAQVVLTGEPALVSAACALLLTVLRHNADGLAVLYRTGIQFFLLAYCGSNLREAARLLKACHLSSASADAVAAAAAGRPLAQRSILGGLLPESLLHILDSYGPDQLAAALVGDSDTPELIWTHRMRLERLVPQMLRHLGDFPRRLRECSHAVYEYTPCPPVGYPEIEGEVFCHRYYLKHLCDEQRHAGWPLADHIQLLQSLLDAWRAELACQPLSMSEGEACGVLGITPQPDGSVPEEELKAAYRRLARLYHPDKNPAGRDKFVGIQAAYERLQAGAAGGQGPQPWRLLLLLRAQCVLFRRAPDVLQPFKYAGYPLLLQAIALPEDGGQGPAGAQHFLSAEAAPQLQAATELCWLTCACSRLNGDELARAGGPRLLARLLMRCIAVMPRDVHAVDPAAVIATHALRALAVMAAFESTRAELAHSSQLVSDIVLCCGLQRAPAAVEAALVCLARCCASPQLQAMLLERGMLGYVVPLLLSYDATHEGGEEAQQAAAAGPAASTGAMPSADDAAAVLRLPLLRTSAQATKNLQAQLAVRALAALAGYSAPTPAAAAEAPAPAQAAAHEAPAVTQPCSAAQRALAALLTETLAPRLGEQDPLPLLRDLNSTVQTPQVIWNNSMRQELLELLEQQRAAAASAAAAAPAAGEGGGAAVAAAATAAAEGFTYRCLQGELVLAGVFVRIYTEQPDFQLSDPAAFCKALVTYIYQQQQVLSAQPAAQAGSAAAQAGPEQQQERQRQQAHLLQALRALRLVLEGAPRLLGLLSTKPAVDPLLECLRPACTAGLAVQTPEGPWAPLPAGGGSEAAAALAAAPPLWAAGSAAAAGALPGASPAELEGAELALTVLLRLTAHAGCIDALSQDKCIVQAFWLAHRAPNASLLMLALRLLNALAGTAACAWGAAAHGGTLFLLSLLLPAYQVPEEQRETFEAARVAAASLLSRLSAHPLHGARVTLLLSKLLPPGLVSAVRDGPGEAAVAALAQSSETPERVWNRSMQCAAAEEVAHLAAAARAHQAATGALEWQPAEGFSLQFQELRGELLVGGVYVRLFLKDPRFPLRNPKLFIEGLLERYVSEVQRLTPGASQAPGSSLVGSPSKPGPGSALVPAKPAAGTAASAGAPTVAAAAAARSAAEGATAADGTAAGADVDLPLLLSAAAVAALQAQPGLAEHAVSLGYVEKLLRLLVARAPQLPPGGLSVELLDADPLLPDEVSGSLLRLLHQLSSCLAAAEALARCTPPAVPPLLGAMRWGTGAAVLALETLKRALAPANRWRDSLVASCLAAGLVTLLLQRLDWRHAAARRQQEQGQQEERDESVQRVLWVDLLNLLALEGPSGDRVRAALDSSDVWAAYRGQRHDLFLPAGGTQAGGVAGLLTGPDAARFALPALMAPPAAAAAGSVVPAPAPVAPQSAAVPAALAGVAIPAPPPMPAHVSSPAPAVVAPPPLAPAAVPSPAAAAPVVPSPAPAPAPAAAQQVPAPHAAAAPAARAAPAPTAAAAAAPAAAHVAAPAQQQQVQQLQPPLRQQAPLQPAPQQAQQQAQPAPQQAQQAQPQQQAVARQPQLDPLSAAAASAADEIQSPQQRAVPAAAQPAPAAQQHPAVGLASPAAARATQPQAATQPAAAARPYMPAAAPLQPAMSPQRQAGGPVSPLASPARHSVQSPAAFSDPLSPGAAGRSGGSSNEDGGGLLGSSRRRSGGMAGGSSGSGGVTRTSDSQDYGPLGPLG